MQIQLTKDQQPNGWEMYCWYGETPYGSISLCHRGIVKFCCRLEKAQKCELNIRCSPKRGFRKVRVYKPNRMWKWAAKSLKMLDMESDYFGYSEYTNTDIMESLFHVGVIDANIYIKFVVPHKKRVKRVKSPAFFDTYASYPSKSDKVLDTPRNRDRIRA